MKARLKELRLDLEETLTQVRGVPMVPISALSGEGIERLMKAVLDIYATWNKRLPTAALNRWLVAMTEKHPPPAVTGRRIKLKYLSQSKTRPPTFYLSCSRPEALPDAYRRYLVNGLREDFELAGVPIRLMVQGGEESVRGAQEDDVMTLRCLGQPLHLDLIGILHRLCQIELHLQSRPNLGPAPESLR